MRQRPNWAAWLGLGFGVLGLVSYFVVLGSGIGGATSTLRDSALVHLALLGIGLGLSVVAIRRASGTRPRYRGRRLAPILAALNVGIAALFIFFLFPFTTLPPVESNAVPVGRPAPDFTLLDETGAAQQLAALRGRNVVLVFYRGHW
jgi:drug/metabolite transporter (DMT)-like permease